VEQEELVMLLDINLLN